MNVILRADDTLEHVSPKGKTFELAELQKAVDGFIELIRLPQGYLFVNEEGRLLGLKLNRAASILAGQIIVGDAILCDPSCID